MKKINKSVKKEILASVIIPTFNIIEAQPAVRQMLKQSYKNKEIILINDNPKIKISLEFLEFVKKNKVRLINNPKNLGIAPSINMGISAARGKVIIPFCGDYVPTSKDLIKHIVEAMYSEEKIGCVVSDIRWPKKVWETYDFMTKIMNLRKIDEKSAVGGAAGCYKKEIFDKLGLFDDKKFAYCGEDSDMYIRFNSKGYTIKAIPDKILHNHYVKRGNLFDMLLKEFRYGEGNGAIKRKYGLFKRVAIFDSHFRVLLILAIIFGLFVYWPISVAAASVFLLATIIQSIIIFRRLKWLPGLFVYPFAGLAIILAQTAGAVYGFIEGRADI
jgi:GT2 family glycosyltransferase